MSRRMALLSQWLEYLQSSEKRSRERGILFFITKGIKELLAIVKKADWLDYPLDCGFECQWCYKVYNEIS
jgi:hypothetical protein